MGLLNLERIANEYTVLGDSFDRPGCGAVLTGAVATGSLARGSLPLPSVPKASFPYIQLKSALVIIKRYGNRLSARSRLCK